MKSSLLTLLPSLAAVGLAALGLAPAAAAQSPAPELPGLVAVRTAGPDLALDLESLGARVGAELAGARRFGPRDVQLLELVGPAGLVDPAAVGARRALVERLVGEPEVLFATRVYADEAGHPFAPTPWILLRFLPSVDDGLQRELLDGWAGLAVERERFGGMEDAWRLASQGATGAEVLAQVEALAGLPGVKWVHPDRVLTSVSEDVIPTDPFFANTWGLDNTGQTFNDSAGNPLAGLPGFDMDLPAAWDKGIGSNGVIVVVLDNGVQTNHPDLNMGPAADFTGSGTGGGPVNGCGDHGTAVAGCVSALMNNGIGGVGAAPGCRVASASVNVPNMPCDGMGSGLASWKVDALDWADGIGARVTNWSFSMGQDDAVSDKLNETEEMGDMIHFASAGNDSGSVSGKFPANDPSTLAVGAVRWDGTLTSFSNTGSEIEFVAPGEQILTTDRTGANGYVMGDYVFINGTSFSSPYAAGVAALIVSRHPAADSFDVERLLEMSGVDMGAIGRDPQHGCGLVDAAHALAIADDDFDAMQIGWEVVTTLPFSLGKWNSVNDAVNALATGGLVIVEYGSYDEAITITKPLTLRRWDAPVVIGK